MQIFYCNEIGRDDLVYRKGLPFLKKGDLPKGAAVVGITNLSLAKEKQHYLVGESGNYAVEMKVKETSWYIPVGNNKYIGVAGKLPKEEKPDVPKKTREKKQYKKEKTERLDLPGEKKQGNKKGRYIGAGIGVIALLLIGSAVAVTCLWKDGVQNKADTSAPVVVIEDSEEMEELMEQSSAEDVSLKELGIVLPSLLSKNMEELLVENTQEGRYLSYNFYQDDTLLATSDMLPYGSSYTLPLSVVKEGTLLLVIDVYDEATFELIGTGEKKLTIQ